MHLWVDVPEATGLVFLVAWLTETVESLHRILQTQEP